MPDSVKEKQEESRKQENDVISPEGRKHWEIYKSFLSEKATSKEISDIRKEKHKAAQTQHSPKEKPMNKILKTVFLDNTISALISTTLIGAILFNFAFNDYLDHYLLAATFVLGPMAIIIDIRYKSDTTLFLSIFSLSMACATFALFGLKAFPLFILCFAIISIFFACRSIALTYKKDPEKFTLKRLFVFEAIPISALVLGLATLTNGWDIEWMFGVAIILLIEYFVPTKKRFLPNINR